VYLVGSEEAAARVRVAITERERVRAAFGTPPANVHIVAVHSVEEEITIIQASTELDAVRGGMGLPGVMVIDLRADDR
jgi:hypothetical protein